MVDSTSSEGFLVVLVLVLLIAQLEQRRDPVGGSSAVDPITEVTAPSSAGDNDVPANG